MQYTILGTLGLAVVAHALPKPKANDVPATNTSILANASYVLPMYDSDSTGRAAEMQQNHAGYLYGPSLIGNTSFFLTGSLGDQLVQSDLALWEKDAAPVSATIQAESVPVVQGLGAVSYHRKEQQVSCDTDASLGWRNSGPIKL